MPAGCSPCEQGALSEPRSQEPQRVTVAGNINEGIDLLAEDAELPAPAESDLVALLNIGGYSASSSSGHCMRGDFSERFMPE